MVINEPITTRICVECGGKFESPTIRPIAGFTWIPKLCPPCGTQRQTTIAAEEAEKQRRKAVEAWETLCPPLYRETNADRLAGIYGPLPRVLAWESGSQGIGLAGASGAGKTRAVFLLLHKLHFAGTRCMATSAKRFENWCHRMFDKNEEARKNIAAAKRVPVLFIDDIGKEKYTERVESEFYDLIESRTSHLLPILWTANANGQQLAQMMGEDRGAPIVRRLREFSTVISA